MSANANCAGCGCHECAANAALIVAMRDRAWLLATLHSIVKVPIQRGTHAEIMVEIASAAIAKVEGRV